MIRQRRDRWLLAIAVFKYLKALLLITVGLGALRLLDPDLVAGVERTVSTMVSPLGRERVQRFIEHVSRMSHAKIEFLGIGAFLYAALFLVEGTGLWLQKRWAEYLTIVSTAVLIPFEIYEIARKVTAPRISALVVNLAVVAYLAVRLRQTRTAGHGERTS